MDKEKKIFFMPANMFPFFTPGGAGPGFPKKQGPPTPERWF